MFLSNYFLKSVKSPKKVLQCVVLRLVLPALLLLSIPHELFSQQDSYPVETLRGKIINARTKQPVAFARIINKNMKKGVMADSVGVFKIQAHRNDTLFIRSINYFPLTLPVSDSLVWQPRLAQISLNEQVYELAGVDLSGWRTYQEFKYKVLHDKLMKEGPEQVNKAIKKSLADISKYPMQEQAAIPLGSPVTALYMLFSKEGKSIRRLEAAKERNKTFLLTYQKFNRQIVSEITGLKGDTLDLFMICCRPSEDFLLVANEYEITLKVLEDFNRFQKEILDKQKIPVNLNTKTP